jgi:hypothetical protein
VRCLQNVLTQRLQHQRVELSRNLRSGPKEVPTGIQHPALVAELDGFSSHYDDRDGDDDSESCHSSRNESKRERKARRRKQKRSNANLATKDSPPRKKNEWNFEEPDDDFNSAFDSAEESEPMRVFEKTNQSGFNKSFLEVSSGEDWLLDLHDCSPLSYMSFIIQRILLAVESN